MSKHLLAICYEMAPATTPTANRSTKILTLLPPEWSVDVVTVEINARPTDRMAIHLVKSRTPTKLLGLAAKLKLDKLTEWLVWPDDKIFWVLPAFRKAMQLIRQQRPDAIAVFMMPYAAGIIGLLLKRLTGLPLIMNLDDSLTCTDMHPFFPSHLHHQMSRKLEDAYVQAADASIYVSEFNRAAVQQRQPASAQAKMHLIRYGADPADFVSKADPSQTDQSRQAAFRIVYLGGMNGWHAFQPPPAQQHPAKRLYQWWIRWGRHSLVTLDQRGSSPVFAGKAIQSLIAAHPDWKDRIHLEVVGNRYPQAVVSQLLESQKIAEVVSVSGPVPNAEAIQIAGAADLLFLTLPGRSDGSSGGRISAKTYEYLMTDRPILAAVPHGENWDYLAGKPGVWLVSPDDVAGMSEAIATLASVKFSGQSLVFDRSILREELSYQERALQFAALLNQVCSTSARAAGQGLEAQSESSPAR